MVPRNSLQLVSFKIHRTIQVVQQYGGPANISSLAMVIRPHNVLLYELRSDANGDHPSGLECWGSADFILSSRTA